MIILTFGFFFLIQPLSSCLKLNQRFFMSKLLKKIYRYFRIASNMNLPVNSPLGGPKKVFLGVKRKYDVITSWRHNVFPIHLCIPHICCEFGHNRARNMVTVVSIRHFWTTKTHLRRRHNVATFYFIGNYAPIYPPCLAWVWRQLDSRHAHSRPKSRF